MDAIVSPKRKPAIRSPFQKLYANNADKGGNCFGCREEVLAQNAISFNKKIYCEEHFCCEKCESTISKGNSYIVRNNHPYCKDCIPGKFPQCNLCHLPIAGKMNFISFLKIQ